jgi:serine/threonine-protein kinase
MIDGVFVCPDCGNSFAQQGFCTEHGTALYDPGDDLLPGQLVGSHRVARLVGRGGMGEVYLAVQPEIGSRVAIKILAPQCALNPQLVERFFAEARAVNVIRHENIVNMIDLAYLPDGRPYIVMEFLDGAPLSDLIARKGPLPLGSAVMLVQEVLDVLGSVHARGITHRDLKPDNVFVTAAGRVKVLDFGIAKLAPELQARDIATRTGALLGTPHYMSPEQARTRPADHRSDLYSTGVILYEALTGRRPFEADALYELLRQHIEQPPPSLRPLRPDLPPALEQVVLRALQKDPALRFQSAADFARALAECSRSLAPDSFQSLARPAPAPFTTHARPAPTAPGTTHAFGNQPPGVGLRWLAVTSAGLLALAAIAALKIVL